MCKRLLTITTLFSVFMFPLSIIRAQDDKQAISALDANALSSVRDRSGHVITANFPGGYTIQYDQHGRTIGATSNRGERIQLYRNAAGRVAGMKASNGKAIEFNYDENGALLGIFDLDGKNLLEAEGVKNLFKVEDTET